LKSQILKFKIHRHSRVIVPEPRRIAPSPQPGGLKAAVALTGRTANGWFEWKSKDGKTLDELKRQTPIPTADQK
jgi:hypothetical protein